MKPAVEAWDDTASNQEQQYLTHGAFRYFGKLPPTLTGRILDELEVRPGRRVVDVMCGSGTTLVEAGLRGARATGIDCNEVSALVARVKTTPLPSRETAALLADFDDAFGTRAAARHLDELPRASSAPRAKAKPVVEAPAIRNFDHWFDVRSARVLSEVRSWIEARRAGPATELARVAFAGAIRSCSRASVRIGRLFQDADKRLPNPVAEVRKRIERIGTAVSELARDPRWKAGGVRVVVGDARSTGLPDAAADVVFCHPPYFALYRYSSDVLRFEMEWMGIDRKAVAKREIEDGFKTTDETLVRAYVVDLIAVAREAHRLARPKGGGKLVFVTADSTLRKQRLSVIEPLIAGTTRLGWRLERRAVRKVRFAQASYHRSADAEIQRPDDEILVFSRR